MKTVVLGAGRMGRRHIQVVKEMGLELVGVADNNPEALSLAQKELKLPGNHLYQDSKDLLNKKLPECVIVATTAPTHANYTCLAAEMGAKYILCEKPMAVSLAECERMIQACKQTDTRLGVNHQMRFMEQYIAPKKLITSAAFGELASVTVIAGNFGMAMNGSHYFEMFRFITDEEPVEVTAWFSPGAVPNPRGDQFEDRAGAVRMLSPSGKRFYMETGSDQGNGLTVIYAGGFGQIVVDELTGEMLVTVREEKYRDLPTTRYGMPSLKTTHRIKPADAIAPSRCVLEALINDEDFPTGETGRLAVAALVAAYLSDENGHSAVTIDQAYEDASRIFPWA